jgi:hypothetical protein
MHWKSGIAAHSVGTLALVGLVACAPSPRAYVADPTAGPSRVAVLPLANYTGSRDAPDRIAPMLAVELAHRCDVSVIDPGRVEAALAQEPWVMLDRLPPDLVDSVGTELGAEALLVGSVLAYGTREDVEGPVPEVALSLRLLEVPGGRVLWSAVHSREGRDTETVFGFGRVASLERLAALVVADVLETFPRAARSARQGSPARTDKEE